MIQNSQYKSLSPTRSPITSPVNQQSGFFTPRRTKADIETKMLPPQNAIPLIREEKKLKIYLDECQPMKELKANMSKYLRSGKINKL